jgi:hypothetical protein
MTKLVKTRLAFALVLGVLILLATWWFDSQTINHFHKPPGVFIKDRGSLYIPIA